MNNAIVGCLFVFKCGLFAVASMGAVLGMLRNSVDVAVSILDNDWLWQGVSIFFGVVQIFVIICYFVWWTNPPEVVFVSDLLNQNVEYKAFMTVFVLLQMVFSFSYAYRHREHHGKTFKLIFLGLITAVVGWLMLSYKYMEPGTDSVSVEHVTGVMFFVGGSTLYFLLMVRNIWTDVTTRYKFGMALLITLFFLNSFGMGVVFMVQFLNKHVVLHSSESSKSWVFEHVGYMSFVCAHVLFFVDETPNPFHQKQKKEPLAGPGLTVASVKIDVNWKPVRYVALADSAH